MNDTEGVKENKKKQVRRGTEGSSDYTQSEQMIPKAPERKGKKEVRRDGWTSDPSEIRS